MALTADQRREARELAYEVANEIGSKSQASFDRHLEQLQEVMAKSITDSQRQMNDSLKRMEAAIPQAIYLHVLECPTKKQLDARENQAKGIAWLMRLAYVLGMAVAGYIGAKLG